MGRRRPFQLFFFSNFDSSTANFKIGRRKIEKKKKPRLCLLFAGNNDIFEFECVFQWVFNVDFLKNFLGEFFLGKYVLLLKSNFIYY